MLAETLDGEANGSIPVLVRAATRTASVTRERLSPDATQALDDLAALVASDEGRAAGRARRPAPCACSRRCPASPRRT